MSYIVEKVLEIIHDYSFKLNNEKNRLEICYKLSSIIGHCVDFHENDKNNIHGNGVDLFNLMININNESISLFKYLNNYQLYERVYKIKNIKKDLNDK